MNTEKTTKNSHQQLRKAGLSSILSTEGENTHTHSLQNEETYHANLKQHNSLINGKCSFD